jgi:hypothetical protein
MIMDKPFPFLLDFDARISFQVGKYLPDVVKSEKTEREPVNDKNYEEGEDHCLNDVYTFK